MVGNNIVESSASLRQSHLFFGVPGSELEPFRFDVATVVSRTLWASVAVLR